MPVLRVSVDLLFGLALLVDSAWLWAAGVLAGVPVRPLRLLAAAALGAAADVLAFFPGGRWLHLGGTRALGTLALVALAFGGRGRWRAVPRALVAYLVLGAMAAGLDLALGPAGPGVAAPADGSRWVVYGATRAPTPLVLAGVPLALAGARLLATGLGAWWQLRRGLVEVVVDLGWGPRRLQGLVDSGNRLRDPLSGDPVVVVEEAALVGAAPADFLALARTGPADPGLPEPAAAWAGRTRWLTYQAVGGQGWLPAMRPLALAVAGQPVRALVAVSPGELGSGAFQALVPAELTVMGVAGVRPALGAGNGGQGG
ncbi:MAG: sigma-E processing peptidase SpoIIGA [Firmicutes bacterium]|nr:sigma-E processing peptidase SpoIIGA [Bacillota bacterium]